MKTSHWFLSYRTNIVFVPVLLRVSFILCKLLIFVCCAWQTFYCFLYCQANFHLHLYTVVLLYSTWLTTTVLGTHCTHVPPYYVSVQWVPLKRQCHEIFLAVFSIIEPIWVPNKQVKMFFLYSFSLRYFRNKGVKLFKQNEYLWETRPHMLIFRKKIRKSKVG